LIVIYNKFSLALFQEIFFDNFMNKVNQNHDQGGTWIPRCRCEWDKLFQVSSWVLSDSNPRRTILYGNLPDPILTNS